MATKSKLSFDPRAVLEDVVSEFRGLDRNQPGQWPLLPKLAVFTAAALMVCVAGWFLLLSATADTLEGERNRETTLKADYRVKLAQAVNLGELRKQKIQVQEYVTQLEKQLPGKAEMDALLSDINQAGLGRGLQFELFRPGQVAVKDYYAELPITLRVSGRYHDIGSFAADIANLSRIVTLHNIAISGNAAGNAAGSAITAGGGAGNLNMDALARTYRYLDPTEVEAQRSARDKVKRVKP